ncbi:MAG: RES family NAD+ phosphorylase [Ferruginibacter sp.]|nr:RES family NAD+ phosphorylase [Ferruginibacter sp.]
MIIYRLAIEAFKDDLSGTGSKLFGGRWNFPGRPAIYTSENISLAVLEIIANANKDNIPPGYCLLKIQVPDNLPFKLIKHSGLKDKWYTDFEYAQFIGSNFLESGKEAMLKMPSAIVKEEYNFLLNPAHPDFKKIAIKESVPFDVDIRLLKK